MLLLYANLHPCGLSTFAKAGEVPKPFSRAPRERNIRWGRVEEVQLRLADDREIERTVECSLSLAFSKSMAQRIRASVGMLPPC